MENILYALGSVVLISLMSLVTILFLAISENKLKKFLMYMVSFSTGAMFAGAFIHLLPETVAEFGFGFKTSLYILIGILFSFIVEKFIHWRHCHNPEHVGHQVHSFAWMNLFGDAVHNFIDGLIIGATYLVSIPLGLATTLAVILHEIPQEIGDFGVLIHGGMKRKRAIFFNFLTALTAILGTLLALIIGSHSEYLTAFLVPFAAGSFIYIAGSDLIPELHKETNLKKSFWQFIVLIFGIIMLSLILLLPHGHSHEHENNHFEHEDEEHLLLEDVHQ